MIKREIVIKYGTMKIILTDSNKHVSSYLKDETKFFPYELYFPDEIKAAGCEILKHLNNLPKIDTNDNNVETQNLASLQTIEKVHCELSNPTHPVSIAMKKMRDVPEIRIIEGLDK